MKKNKIVYILLFVILLFSFSSDVKADITCIYEKPSGKKKIVLVQKNGVTTIYRNSSDASLTDSGWVADTTVKYSLDSDLDMNDDKTFNSCPGSISYSSGVITFHKNTGAGKADLEDSSNSAEDVGTGSSSSSNSTTSQYTIEGDTCGSEVSWLDSSEEPYLKCLYKSSADKVLETNFDNGSSSSNIYHQYVGCYTIQINFYASGEPEILTSSNMNRYQTGYFSVAADDNGSVSNTWISNNLDTSESCPSSLYVSHTYVNTSSYESEGVYVSFEEFASTVKQEVLFTQADVWGQNLSTGEEATISENVSFSFNINFSQLTSDLVNCEDIFASDSEFIGFMSKLVTFAKILIPIALVVLGTLDFGKAVFAQDENDIKKAQSKFIRRVIIAIVIFLVPTILKLLLTAAHQIWSVVPSDLCGIL